MIFANSSAESILKIASKEHLDTAPVQTEILYVVTYNPIYEKDFDGCTQNFPPRDSHFHWQLIDDFFSQQQSEQKPMTNSTFIFLKSISLMTFKYVEHGLRTSGLVSKFTYNSVVVLFWLLSGFEVETRMFEGGEELLNPPAPAIRPLYRTREILVAKGKCQPGMNEFSVLPGFL